MKKRIGIWILVIALLPLAANARGNRLNLIGSLGMATSNNNHWFGLYSMGTEMEFFPNFYGQLNLDFFADIGPEDVYSPYDNVSFTRKTLRARALELNLSGIYKFPLDGRGVWFIKAGFSYVRAINSYSGDDYDDDYYDDNNDSYEYDGYYNHDPGSYYSSSYYIAEEDATSIKSGWAYALGTGIEYQVNDNLALTAGITYMSVFKMTLHENGKCDEWVKIIMGVSYRLK